MDASTTAFVAGVAISIGCSVCNSLGMGLQRQTHLKLAALPPGEPRAFFHERKWLIGLCFMATASLLSLGNYSLLGQARASAMASLTIVTNAVMAHYMLGEQFTRIDGATTALIGAGIIVAVVFGSQGGGAPQTSLSDVLVLLQRDEVYVATAVIFVLFVTGEIVVRAIERKGAARTHAEGKIECFCRAFLAGLFSGLTGFLAKSVVVSIEYMAAEKSASDLGRFQIWLLGISLPCSIVMQLRHLNGGLRRFNAMDIVPIYQACIVVIGVAWGWIFYLEDQYLEQLDMIMFAVGVLISILGIVVLSFKGSKPSEDGQNECTPLLRCKEKSASAASASEDPPPAASWSESAVESSAVGEENGKQRSSKVLVAVALQRSLSARPSIDPLQPGDEEFAPQPLGSESLFGGEVSDHGGSSRSRNRASTLVTPSAGFVDAIDAFAPALLARFVSGNSARGPAGSLVRAQSFARPHSLSLSHPSSHSVSARNTSSFFEVGTSNHRGSISERSLVSHGLSTVPDVVPASPSEVSLRSPESGARRAARPQGR